MQDWKERFDEHFFSDRNGGKEGGYFTNRSQDIKAFISDLLAERDAEWREAVKMEKKAHTCMDYGQPGWQKDITGCDGYNAAIDELNERIATLVKGE